MYKVEYSHTAIKAIQKAPAHIRVRVMDSIKKLAENPYSMAGVKKMTGCEAYRLRVGEWRIVYAIHNDILTVVIIKAGNRKEIYR